MKGWMQMAKDAIELLTAIRQELRGINRQLSSLVEVSGGKPS